MKEIRINKNDSGQRLDKFMQKRFKTMPLSLLYKYLRKKCVKINGIKTSEPETMLKEGDLLAFYISDEFFENKKIENNCEYATLRQTFLLIYEDENILIADKSVGLLCQSDEKESRNTLINQIKGYLINKGEYDPNRENSFAPALCNRIDKNTQGIVLAAKNAEALRILNQKIKEHEIDKFYRCLVFGRMEKNKETLTAYLKKDSTENHVHILPCQSKNGDYKKIITSYEVLSYNDGISKLSIALHTGRTHQIRAHMAFIGHPILGDTKYGTAKQNEGYPYKFQALSSCKVVFSFKTDAGILNYLKNKNFLAEPFFEK